MSIMPICIAYECAVAKSHIVYVVVASKNSNKLE